MQIVKVHFGGEKPPETEYIKKADGMAEVWLYRDIHEEVDPDGNSDFVADGVFFTTCLAEEDVENNRDMYFADDSDSSTKAEVKTTTVSNEEHLTREEFDLLRVTDSDKTYYITETDGTITITKGEE